MNAIAAVAEVKDESPRGNLGLSGVWALVGNSTAMVCIAVLVFVMFFQVRAMHAEAMQRYDRLFIQQQSLIERNTSAIDRLTDEMSRLRASLAQR